MGMWKKKESKVTIYNKKGKEIHNIPKDNKGQKLYNYPNYITEKINVDICVLDQEKKAVVVVIASGQLRFSYKGDQKSEFSPGGLCTDILSHTLVCDKMNSAVQLLDEDSRFLSLLLIQQGMSFSLSVYID